jgi:hypothetical protein
MKDDSFSAHNAICEAWMVAFNEGDFNKIYDLYDSDLYGGAFFFPTFASKAHTAKEKLNYFEALFAGPKVTVATDQPLVALKGENGMTVVYGNYTFKYDESVQKEPVHASFSMVIIDNKIAAHYSSWEQYASSKSDIRDGKIFEIGHNDCDGLNVEIGICFLGEDYKSGRYIHITRNEEILFEHVHLDPFATLKVARPKVKQTPAGAVVLKLAAQG